MALYELAEAQLAPAQFGRPAQASAVRDALEAVRTQLLDVLSLPIFPVSWQRVGHGDALTALNSAGDIIVVMVTEHMDAATLVAGLAHASAMSSMGIRGVAAAYPGGMDSFRADWQEFRDAVPLHAPLAERLIVLAAHLADDVRTSLPLVAPSGVQVHTVDVRRLASGRHFVHIEPLSAQPMDQVRSTLLVARPQRQEVEAAPAMAPAPSHESDVAMSASTPVDDASDSVSEQTFEPSVRPQGDAADSVATPDSDRDDAEKSLSGSLANDRPGRESHPEGDQASWPDPWDPSMSEEALAKVAHALGAVTEVVWQSLRRGIFHVATIDTYGVMTLNDGRTFTDPTEAACQAQGVDDVDGWHVWRFGPHGPTLRQAWEEVRDVDLRMATKPSGRRARS